MRSRAARLVLSTTAWIAIGSAAMFIATTEQQIAHRGMSLRAFDQRARETADALADVRAGLQAYVAAGQGVAFWMPKVATLLDSASTSVDELRGTAASTPAREALLEAAAALTELRNIDKRAREYLRAGEPLMAGDVVFSEGGDTAMHVAHRVESARLDEHQDLDRVAAAARRREAYVAGSAAGWAALVLALLVFVPRTPKSAAAVNSAPESIRPQATPPPVTPPAIEHTGTQYAVTAEPPASQPAWPDVATLKAAAELCTDIGRVSETTGLTALLGRTARLLDASGVIVWLENPAGGDLRAALAFGYPNQALTRMPAVDRGAHNAIAAAYRTGSLQVVPAGSHAQGAVIAPLLAVDGCVGALSAEVKEGAEVSAALQALAVIVAAQLASILGASASAPADAATANHAASA